MVARVIVRTRQVLSGYTSQTISRPNYGYAPIDFTYLGFSNPISTFVTGTVNSVSTPGFYVKKTVYKKWIPRNYPLLMPSRPPYCPPRLPKEPRYRQRRDLTLSKKDRIKRDSYVARLQRAKERRQLYASAYSERLLKYEKRLANYYRLQTLRNQGVLRYKRVTNRSHHRPNNPYSFSRTTNYGFWGTWVHKQWCTRYIHDYNGWLKNFYTLTRTAPTKIVYLFEKQVGFFSLTYVTHGSYDHTALVAACEGKGISSLYEKLSDQSVHIAMMVAERAQTFSLISNAAKTLASVLKTKKRLLNTNLDTVAGDVLAYNFGIVPLLSDAYGAGVALAKLASDDQSDKVVVRSTSTQTDNSESTVVDLPNVRRIVRRVECEVKISYVLEYRVKNGDLSELQKLGLINPAEIAWEALPWSFAIDWFLPIGNYITSLSADAGLEFVTGTKTTTITKRYTTQITLLGDATWDTYSTFEGDICGSKTEVTKDRVVLTAPPVPRLPQFKSPISATHIVESLALLVQLRKK